MKSNGHRNVTIPKIAAAPAKVSFSRVSKLLRSKNAAEGFTQAAEILLDRFNDLAPMMGAAAVVKLAIDCHKHGLFCEVAQDKTRSQHDTAAYEAYQKYLAGDGDPVAIGLPTGPITVKATSVDDEAEESDGDEDDSA